DEQYGIICDAEGENWHGQRQSLWKTAEAAAREWAPRECDHISKDMTVRRTTACRECIKGTSISFVDTPRFKDLIVHRHERAVLCRDHPCNAKGIFQIADAVVSECPAW